MILRICLAAALSVLALESWAQPANRFQRSRYRQESLAPYVPSPQVVVEKMVEAAHLKAGETLFDLGCGDGRIPITAAREFKIKGICVELMPDLVAEARANVLHERLDDRIEVVQANMLDVDLRPADVVTLYLLTSSNETLRPILEKSLRPGARVISHDFQMQGWKANKVESVRASGRDHSIYVYVMPPKKNDK